MQLTALIGKKIYQKQGFLQDGTRIPLTGVSVSGNLIAQIKSKDKEGYSALQIATGEKTKANKTLKGHLKKAGIEKNSRFFREIRVEDTQGAILGSELNIAEVFAPGDTVDVTGISKGKGWAGGVKRWGFRGGPRTHGQSDRERAPGSIGQTTTPGRVYKGKKMAGRMGHEKVTIKNLEVVEVTDDGILLIKGLVPGALNSILTVKKVGENKKFVPLYKEEVKVEESVSQPSVSEEVLKTNDEEQASASSSLNKSQHEESKEEEKKQEVLVSDSSQKDSSTGVSQDTQTSAGDSSEEAQTPIDDKKVEEKKEEVKEEVGKDAKS